MNKIKKSLALILSLVLALSALALGVSADSTDEGTLRVMAYNVSGIPFAGAFHGSKVTSGARKARILGGELNKLDLDIIGTQEDFNFHPSLAKKMTAFPYKTYTSGSVPLGDGLNVFSKLPIYNVTRTGWEISHGILTAYTDELTKKGYMRTVVEIQEGVYIDLYVLHAEAGDEVLSIAARADNYRQLAEDIVSRGDRASLVIGDFNSRLNRTDRGDIYANLMEAAGLLDVWAELHNEGKYVLDHGADWSPSLGESVDKILYKNGGGIEFSPENLEHIKIKDSKGETYTDHNASLATLNYKITDYVQNTEELLPPEKYNQLERFSDFMKALFETIKLIFSDLKNLPHII